YGMALVWGVMNIINLTQGEFVIFGGFIAFYTSRQWTLDIGALGVSVDWPGRLLRLLSLKLLKLIPLLYL
ncbi:MAG: hypothetical protein OQJ89_11335, partial [Kangiellaceae bacterium]|nr:hypothetical protein [Kangiellaceae bacterium]